MLSVEEMKSFLLHDEGLIRRYAAKYLVRTQTNDEDIMPLFIKAYRKEKDVMFRGYIAMQMENLSMNSETVNRVYRLAKNVAKDRHHFERALAYADMNIIKSAPKKIRLSIKEYKDILKYRIEISQKDTTTLLEEFNNLKEIAKNNYEEFDFEKAKILSKELSNRSNLPMEKIHKWFEKYSWKNPDFDEVFMCLIAGDLKLVEYADLLLKSLRIDWDYINEESMYALVKMQSPLVVEKIEKMFLKENKGFQCYASTVLGDTKTLKSEEILVNLLKKANTKFLNTQLIFALCDLGSEKAIKLGEKLLPDGYDDSFDSLEENLYIVSVINDIDHPKLNDWKIIAYENEKRIRSIREEI
ncbi:MAG: hypothetical protein FH751_10390 [Firmicutes bacterium]|nr:hypothetical protein [Bacillota bacterium]